MKIKMTAKEYLMECVSRWDDELEGYWQPTEHDLGMARLDLLKLASRCRALLPRSAKCADDHDYLSKLWLAKDAIARNRPDAACGYLHEMLYFHTTQRCVPCGILVNIIAVVEEGFHVETREQDADTIFL